MSNGLSNATFMGGLMQGAQFVEGMQNRKKQNERADAQAARAQEAHDQTTKLNGLKIDEAELKTKQRNARLLTRRMRETNSMPTKEELKELKVFGVDKFASPDFIEESQNAGALIHKAMQTGEWGAPEIGALGTTFYDENKAREKVDGLSRRPVNVQKIGEDKFVLINELTDKEGKKYTAPLTKNGTADDDDNLVIFTQDTINQIHEVQMQRANMAYLWEKSKNDPKAAADLLDNIIFGKTKQEAPGLATIYDKATGGDQKVVWNGSQYVPIGGVKANGGKNGRGGSGGNGGFNDDSAIIDWKEYRDKRAAALKEGDPEMLDQVDAMFESTYGFSVDDFNSFRLQREERGIYDNPTVAQTRAFLDGSKHASSSRSVENEINQNPNLFGTNQGLADQQQAEINNFAQVSGDDPDGLAAIAEQNQQAVQISNAPPRELAPNPRIAELEQLMADPAYPDGARAKFEQEYNQLIAKHNGNGKAKPPQKISRQDKYKQDIEAIQNQIANAQSEEERARLSQLLVKTMTEFNKSPGLNDAAHMAAL